MTMDKVSIDENSAADENRFSLLEVDPPTETEKQAAREKQMAEEEFDRRADARFSDTPGMSLTDKVRYAISYMAESANEPATFRTQDVLDFYYDVEVLDRKKVSDAINKLVKLGEVEAISRGVYREADSHAPTGSAPTTSGTKLLHASGEVIDTKAFDVEFPAGLKETAVTHSPALPVAAVPVDATPATDGVEAFAVRAREARRARSTPEVVVPTATAPVRATEKKNPHGLIATSAKSEVTGATVWWQLSGAVSKTKLRDAFVAEGLGAAILDSASPSAEKLVRRLAKAEGGKGKIVSRHPLGGWSVIKREGVGADSDEGQEVVGDAAKAWKADSRRGIRLYLTDNQMCVDGPALGNAFGTPADIAAIRSRVVGAYLAATEAFDSKDISTWITRFVGVALAGVSLRWNGGMYFIPNQHVDTYEKLERAFSLVTSHRMYEMPTMSSTSTLKAIIDAVRREATEEVTKVENAIAEIGPQARAARLQELGEVLDKVLGYEKLFGHTFGDTTKNIRRVMALVQAAATRSELLEVD